MAAADLTVDIKVKPHSNEEITADCIGDVVVISGKTFLFEAIGDVRSYKFIGNMKGRRVIRENIKSIRNLMLSGGASNA